MSIREVFNSQSPMIVNVFSFLRSEEQAVNRRINRTSNAVTTNVSSLCNAINTAKHTAIYIQTVAPKLFFYTPSRKSLNGYTNLKMLNYRDLAILAKHLRQHGNDKTNVHKLLGENETRDKFGFYTKLSDPELELKPTEIIKMLPREEIGRIYQHMGRVKGWVKKPDAGKYAFYDKHGSSSTSAEKAEAIWDFLKEKAWENYKEPTCTQRKAKKIPDMLNPSIREWGPGLEKINQF